MSFLAPLFLIGAVVIGLPILFHLIRRSSRERIPFSSLMFLLPTPPRVTRRSKLENVLLLILRCLVVFLLAFAFARPFFSKAVPPDPNVRTGQKILLLMDTSASMRRGNLWAQAKDKAASILKNLTLADQLACVTFDREVRPLVSFEQWSLLPASDRANVVAQRLEATSPGWGSTRLGSALIAACEMFDSTAKNEQSTHRIVLITDLQEGSRLEGLQGFEWPRSVEITIEALKSKRVSNAGIQLASESEDAAKPAGATVRVQVSNASDSKREQFQVGWRQQNGTGFIGPTIDTYIPPGQNRVVAVPIPKAGPVPDRLGLAGDDEDFDNVAYVVPPKPERSKVVVLGSDDPKDPAQSLYYVRRAFQETRRLAVEVLARKPGTGLSDAELASARLLIVTDSLPEEQIQQVRAFLREDRAVLMPLASAAMTATLSRLIAAESVSAEEARDASYAMLSQISFEHPLFSPFADPRYSDFTKIHFWKHRRVALEKINGCRILARFDNNDPALAEIATGQGKVWVLTSGWQPAESQLALSSKFVPLLYSMLEQSGGAKEQRVQFIIGDSVSLPDHREGVTVRKPDASEVKVRARERFTGTDQPGIYTVTSVQPPVSFAVNVAPEESRTAPMAIEELERLGLPLQHQFTSSPKQIQQRREHLQAVQLENRQKLWRWLIVAALVVLVVETWLAGRLTRRAVAVVPETSG